jgi:hypothetical protein
VIYKPKSLFFALAVMRVSINQCNPARGFIPVVPAGFDYFVVDSTHDYFHSCRSKRFSSGKLLFIMAIASSGVSAKI